MQTLSQREQKTCVYCKPPKEKSYYTITIPSSKDEEELTLFLDGQVKNNNSPFVLNVKGEKFLKHISDIIMLDKGIFANQIPLFYYPLLDEISPDMFWTQDKILEEEKLYKDKNNFCMCEICKKHYPKVHPHFKWNYKVFFYPEEISNITFNTEVKTINFFYTRSLIFLCDRCEEIFVLNKQKFKDENYLDNLIQYSENVLKKDKETLLDIPRLFFLAKESYMSLYNSLLFFSV